MTLSKPFFTAFRIPIARHGNHANSSHRRRHATIDLSHASAHLRRDIGVLDEPVTCRHP